jgi:hypothetical protein
MTENEVELARKFTALPNWRWMPGMLVREEHYAGTTVRLVWHDIHGWNGGTLSGAWMRIAEMRPTHVPVLDDPATLGCILALVREAWNDQGIAAVVASYTNTGAYLWRVIEGHHHGSHFRAMSVKTFLTEAEALYAALDGARQ